MLAKRDGISVLRYANAMDKPPVGLVTSGFITDYVAMTVSNLGVQYLMMKPATWRPWWSGWRRSAPARLPSALP